MRKLLYFVCLTLLLFACGSKDEPIKTVREESSDQTELLQTYEQADSLYRNGTINTVLFDSFISKATQFADTYPENEITPDILSKAGVACMILAKNVSTGQNPDEESINKYAHQGLGIFEKIQAIYPDYEGVKSCFLNRAFIYDDILHKYLDAEYEYREFLHKYPDDSACENIRAYLKVLGKSEEEVMASLEQKK